MRTALLVAIAAALSLGPSRIASAQEHGKTGITLGYPGDVGILWHVSENAAIRPAFSFSHSSSDSAAGTTSSGWGTGLGVSALFYLKKYDNLRTYVTPQFLYAHSTTSTNPGTTQGAALTVASSGNSTGGNGGFGAEYAPSPHFAVYGEFGVGFAHQKSTFNSSAIPASSTKSTTWGTFAGVGVIFYP